MGGGKVEGLGRKGRGGGQEGTFWIAMQPGPS